MCTYGFFPKNYSVFRRDLNVIGGGVFVAETDRIISYEISDLDTDSIHSLLLHLLNNH